MASPDRALNIFLIGQDQFGEAVYGRLKSDGQDIVGVIAPKNEVRPDRLWVAAENDGLEPISDKTMNDPNIQGRVKALGADVGVAAFVTEFVPLGIREATRLGIFEYHPSLLPRHRGPEAMRVAIQVGDSETGLTIFRMVRKMDAGPVLLRRKKEIGIDDNVTRLYFGNGGLFEMGVDALSYSMRIVALEVFELTEQDESLATLHTRMKEEEALIPDLVRNAARAVHDFIRGADPVPGAWAVYNGGKLKLYDSSFRERVSGELGEIVDISEEGALIALNDGSVLIRRVGGSAGKIKAKEYGFRVGDRVQS